MMPRYVYIAGPYTKGDVILNIREIIFAADNVRSLGYVPYLPHLTAFWHLVVPHEDIGFWYEFDLAWLEKCDLLLRLPGESHGADEEVKFAQERGIPVFYSLEELINFGGPP